MSKKIIAVVLGIVLVASGCANDNKNHAANQEAKVGREQLSVFLQAQPVPVFKTSQLRQNLIEIETAQANATVTTSFFFNQGVADPITACPSIGFAIPSTDQLTNPEAKVQEHEMSLPQLESNGVYTGVSTGTYVICVDGNGKGFAFYWEGFVATVAGPAKWDASLKQIVLTGAPSADFSTGG